MSISKEEKEKIADRVVEILRSPQKKELIDELRQQVFSDQRPDQDGETTDDVVYAVLQALEELYG